MFEMFSFFHHRISLKTTDNVKFSKNGFNPADEHNKKTANKATNNSSDGLIIKAKDIFARVPTLWALFCEILACQGLSTLLNVLCVTKVSEVIPDDTKRAGWMGKVSTLNYRYSVVCSYPRCLLIYGVSSLQQLMY